VFLAADDGTLRQVTPERPGDRDADAVLDRLVVANELTRLEPDQGRLEN
jgi:hypothetical protein